MKVVYVAGPFSAPNTRGVHLHVMAAERVAARLAELGAMPLTPHSIGAHMEGVRDYEFWIEGTLELLRRSDAMVLAEGWTRSRGVALEVMEARRLSIPMFDAKVLFETPELFTRWLESETAENDALSAMADAFLANMMAEHPWLEARLKARGEAR